MSDDWDTLLRAATEQGWSVERRTRHTWLRAPSGDTVCLPSSASDRRAIHNCVAGMRRLGFSWRGRAGPRRPAAMPVEEPDQGSLPALMESALAADELIYDALVREQRGLSITELAARTRLSRREVQLVTESLEQADFIRRSGFRPREKRGVRPEPVYQMGG